MFTRESVNQEHVFLISPGPAADSPLRHAADTLGMILGEAVAISLIGGTIGFLLSTVLTGGGGSTREHGWFGHTTLIGGTGPNQLVGLAGHVKFKPTKSSTLIFAGEPRRRTSNRCPSAAERPRPKRRRGWGSSRHRRSCGSPASSS